MNQVTVKNIESELWQADLEKSSGKYHTYGAYIAVIFNPIFGITDYLNIPHAWYQVLAIRVSISIITLIMLGIRTRFLFSSRILIFVPFLLISLQNAYTFSLIEVDDFTGHSLNYMALFIGGGMFILWPWYYSAAVIIPSTIANIIFFNMNHELDLQQSLVNGGLLLIVVTFFMFLLIETRFQLTISMIKSKLALLKANEALSVQKNIIESKNKDITDSINYAKRIQTAMLPMEDRIGKAIHRYFILFKPRDIVSGDFYWFAEKEEKVIIAAIDCTGHGIPGAFMSMVGDSVLNSVVHDKEIHQPDLILNEMHHGIRLALQQDTSFNKDGMDMVLIVINKVTRTLEFAGAKNSLVYIQNNQLNVIKGDKVPIGGEQREKERIFTKHTISIDVPTTIYLFSDGYQDQFGGKEGKKFMILRMKELLLSIHQESMEKQKQILDTTIMNWMEEGRQSQIDDILVMGLKVG